LSSPSLGKKKRIHFNKQVKQYIALEIKGDDEAFNSYVIHDDEDSDLNDGAIIIKQTNLKRKLTQECFNGDSKTIAMLPSTTLNNEESSETAQSDGF
jgi:hypothetical protein